MRALATAAAIVLAWATLAVADAPKAPKGPLPPPKLAGHVVTTVRALNNGEGAEYRLSRLYQDTGYAIVAYVVPSLAGVAIADVAYETFKAWKPGRAGKDDGVLIVVAVAERAIRIETGKGIGGGLTDLQSDDIIRATMAPLIAKGEIDEALEAAGKQISGALVGHLGAHPIVYETWLDRHWRGFVGTLVGVVVILIVGSVASKTFRKYAWIWLQIFYWLFRGVMFVVALFSGRGGSGGYRGGGGTSGGGGASDSF